jgi:cobalt/nickel transport system permease protein
MKHSFIDEYSDLDSFIHNLDPRTKLIACLTFIVFIVLTPVTNWLAILLYFCVITVLLLISKLPLHYVLKRSLVVFPFVLMIAVFIPFFKQGEVAGSYNIGWWQVSVTYNGLIILANVVTKAWLCILSLILLSSTTRLADLLKGLRQLHVPHVIILILSFMYRYIFVLMDEMMRMKQARDSRNFGGSRLYQLRIIGNMIGTLFIRSYERGERVYSAMLARGFDGEVRTIRTLRFSRNDVYFAVSFGLVLIMCGVFWLWI